MAHDPLFEQRIMDVLTGEGVKAEPRKMFGGVAFMVKGNMCVGITNKGDFMARFDPTRHEEILGWPGAKPMTFGHKGMKGFLFVGSDAVASRPALDKWVKLSLDYVNALPAKKGAKKKPAVDKQREKKPVRRR